MAAGDIEVINATGDTEEKIDLETVSVEMIGIEKSDIVGAKSAESLYDTLGLKTVDGNWVVTGTIIIKRSDGINGGRIGRLD